MLSKPNPVLINVGGNGTGATRETKTDTDPLLSGRK
jgi:hypothetical protein